MDVYHSFPLLVPVNKEKTRYNGFIQVQGESFHIEVNIPKPESLEGATLHCECKLRDTLRCYSSLVNQRLKHSSSLNDFLQELQRLVELQLKKKGTSIQQVEPPLFYSRLVEEISQLGWNRLVFIDAQFKELHLVAKDRVNRSHILKVHLRHKHPQQPPTCTADLPTAFDFAWNVGATLQDLLTQFARCLESHQDLWSILDDLDQKTWILEPEKPTRADLNRRIALGNNASLQVTVSVQQPRALPECCFMGAEHVIGPLKSKLNSNLHLWDMEKSLLHNLQTLLGMTFPSPKETNKEDFSLDCGICYAYHLDTEIPNQCCEDPRCGQPFHYTCLYEWLRSLPSFRQSFNVAFGECPYCNTPITVKMSSR